MKTLILDTNIFLRFLLNDIPSQTQKIEAVLTKAKIAKIKLYVPQIVIFEIVFALDKYYKFPKNQIIDKLDSILKTTYFNIQDKETFLQAMEIYTKKDISFVDCFLLGIAKIQNQDIFTFNQELVKLSEKV